MTKEKAKYRIKPTDTNIGKMFGVTRQTVYNYKNGDKRKRLLYEAMKDKYIKDCVV